MDENYAEEGNSTSDTFDHIHNFLSEPVHKIRLL